MLLELALVLHIWLERIDLDTMRDLSYESMDYEDKPILEFTEQKGEWRIYSRWRKFCCTRKIDLIELIKAVEVHISNLQQQLKNDYNFAIKNWLKSRAHTQS